MRHSLGTPIGRSTLEIFSFVLIYFTKILMNFKSKHLLFRKGLVMRLFFAWFKLGYILFFLSTPSIKKLKTKNEFHQYSPLSVIDLLIGKQYPEILLTNNPLQNCHVKKVFSIKFLSARYNKIASQL